MSDYARLGIIVDADGAIIQTKRITAELRNLSAAGREAQGSMKMMNGLWVPMGTEVSKVTRLTESAHLSTGRLGNQFESLTSRILGLNPVIGKLSAVLGDFALGSTVTVALLGGITLIASAYDKLTESSRKAMEAADKLIESYLRLARVRLLGVGGEHRAAIEDLDKGVTQYGNRAGFFSGLASMFGNSGVGGLFGGIASGYTDKIGEAGRSRQSAVNELGLAIGADNDAKAAKAKAEADKAAAAAKAAAAPALAAEKAFWDKQHTLFESARDFIQKLTADMQAWAYETRNDIKYALDKEIRDTATSGTSPNIGLNDGLTRRQIRQRGAMGIHLEGDSAGGGIDGAVAGALNAYSPANIAGGLVSSGLSLLADGLKDMALSMINGGEAARKYAQEMRRITLDYAAATAAFKHDNLATSLAQNAQQAEQLRRLAEAQYLTILQSLKDHGAAYRAELEKIAAQEAKNAELIQRQAGYAQEDLAVRNLKALGRGDEADLLGFKNQQSREMQAAIDANKDALYINTLAMVQGNELLAFQNGLLSTALRNVPTGFYGIEGYAGQYATPRGPWNTDGGSVSGGGGADNSNGGLNAGSGKGRAQTIILQVDGKVLTRVVVNNVDQFASSTGGAGSSRSDALNRYPA